MASLRSTLRRRAIGALGTLGFGVLGALALVGEYGHRQITRARRSEFRDQPANWGLPNGEEITLQARDGIGLHAWLFTAPDTASSIVVCHGHGGNKHTLLPAARFLFPRYNVLALDSRGHGDSGGQRTTIGYEERMDVRAAVDELARRGLGPVGIMGTSMGAAVAILAAAEDMRLAAIVSDSPYARLRWAVAEAARGRGYPCPIAPIVAFAACQVTALRLGYPMSAFDPLHVVHRIAPRRLLLIHGQNDELLNVRHSRLLYERAGEPKELWVLSGLAHCQGLECVYEAYRDRVLDFFAQALCPRPYPLSS